MGRQFGAPVDRRLNRAFAKEIYLARAVCGDGTGRRRTQLGLRPLIAERDYTNFRGFDHDIAERIAVELFMPVMQTLDCTGEALGIERECAKLDQLAEILADIAHAEKGARLRLAVESVVLQLIHRLAHEA